MRETSRTIFGGGVLQTLLGGFIAAGAELETPLDPSGAIAARIPRQETGAESDHLTGDWNGLRTRLVDRGVHLYAGYTGEILANVSGGLRRGAIYEGLLEMAVDLDTTKLTWWKNGLIHASSLYPHGSGFSSHYAGDILTLSNIDAYDSLRLYELWYQQTFADGKFNIRFGQLLADEEFTYTDAAENFINSAFGWPAFISANAVNTGPAYFVAATGVRLRYEPTTNWYVQSGVYDGDTFDSAEGDPHVNAHGTHFHLSRDQGIFWLSEAGYTLNPDSKESLEGSYKLGAWLHTGDFVSNFSDRNGDPFVITGLEPEHHQSNFGAYVSANQMVWRSGERDVSLFGRIGGSPPDRSLFELVCDGGFTVTGLVPARLDDDFGAGVVYARFSRDIRAFEKLDAVISGATRNGFSEHEMALEIYYSAQLTKWWSIQPDFQWIFNPGGRSEAQDAVVLGIRSSIVF